MDGDIQGRMSLVHDREGYANQAGEKLKQLGSTIKEEGLFCVEWCLVLSVSTISNEISLLNKYAQYFHDETNHIALTTIF